MTIGVIAIVLVIYFTGLFFWAQYLKNNSIVDIAWVLGFFIVAVTGYLVMPEPTMASKVTLVLVSVWGGAFGPSFG